MLRSRYIEVFEKGKRVKGTRITPLEMVKHNKHLAYRCRCDCGKETIVAHSSIVSGTTKSCGCLRDEKTVIRFTTHGLSKTDEYYAAHNAWDRCTRKSHKYYKDYGGRGITFGFGSVEEMTRWLLKNLPKPNPSLVLDRKDNSKGYTRDNLKWSTRSESSRNQRGNRIVTINGISKKMVEWSEETGIGSMTLHCRIRDGMPEELWLYKGRISKAMLAERMFNQVATAKKGKKKP